MRFMHWIPIGLAVTTACGGDDGDREDAATELDAPVLDAPIADADPGAPDAGRPDASPDAKESTVIVLEECVGLFEVNVTVVGGSRYQLSPDATIPVGTVARFDMPVGHDATSGPPNQPDGLFVAPANAVTCLRFTEAGSFQFHCEPHDFTATLTVSPN